MKKRLLIFLCATLAVLSGCMRRPLEYGGASVNLHLNVHLNVRVNGQIESLPEPEMMRVMFFDPQTNELCTESYLPAGGGRITLPPGRYKFLAYNFDTESTLLRNERNYYSIEAYTNEVSSALKSSMMQALRFGRSAAHRGATEESAWEAALEKVVNNPVIYEPDHLFVSREEVEILNTNEEQVIHAEAETVVETWQLSVRISDGKSLSSARALLTGQVASNFIGYPKEEGKTDTDVTLMFEMAPGSDAQDNDILVAEFNTFGKNPSVDSRLWLTIIIKNTSGETVEWHRDITDEFFMEDAKENNRIDIIEEIEVPEPEPGTGGGGGGFQPGVEDWEQEDIPITI